MPDLTKEDLRHAFTNFETLIADGTRNVLDLPSVYDFNNERYRFFKDTGTGFERVNDISGEASITDNANHFLISCPAGERREIRTAEFVRYQAGFELEWGDAWRARADLSDGQSVKVRATNYERTERIEVRYYNNGGTLFGEVRIIKGGSELVQRDLDVSDVDATAPRISRMFENLYGVGMQTYRETFTDASQQQRNSGRETNFGEPTDFNLNDFNLHVGVEVDCLNASSGLDVEAGSIQAKVRGATLPTVRNKPVRLTGLFYDATVSGNFEPVAAFRVDLSRDNVYCDLKNTQLAANGNESGELVAMAYFDDEVSFGGSDSWSTPVHHSTENSVIEVREDVSSVKGNSTVADPEGRNLGLAASNFNKKGGSLSGTDSDNKRSLHRDEVVVLWLRTDSGSPASTDGFDWFGVFEQDW